LHVRGALHVHSRLSHDGTLTIPDLAAFFRGKGYDFVAMGEHSQDIDEPKAELLRAQCAASSDTDFCMIPGVEFSCRGGFHIFGLGAVGVTREVEPLAVVEKIHALNGLAILAHPQRYGWKCPPELLRVLDGVEIWNIGYDGKYLPALLAPRVFESMRAINPKLLATAGHDFHRKQGFYNVGIEMDIEALHPADIMECIRHGAYTIRSRFFSAGADPRFTWPYALGLNLMSRQLAFLRRARDLMLRLTS
jgi:predicted metal-dependent phosphoesterase TrpH